MVFTFYYSERAGGFHYRSLRVAGLNCRVSMTTAEIEYCVPCGMRDRVVDLQTAILEAFGQSIDAVSLVTGDDGIFEVCADGDLVFNKDEDDYDVEAIVDAVSERVGAPA